MNADGTNQTRLTNVGTTIQFGDLSWSQGADIAVTGRTASSIVTQRFSPPDSAIYSLHPDGTLTRLSGAPPASDSSPDW
jgi:hypothetical protein